MKIINLISKASLIVLVVSCSPKNENKFTLISDNSYRLDKHNLILVDGQKIGSVEKVKVGNTGTVFIDCIVADSVKLPTDSKFNVTSADLLGTPIIDVQLGSSKSFISSKDTLILNPPPSLSAPKIEILKKGIEVLDSLISR